MTPTESQYFALLRSALWNTPLALSGPIDWKGVMRIANHHGNTSLLGDLATRMTDDRRPSDEMLRQMRDSMRANLVNQLHLKQILVAAVQMLRQNGIEPVLLKGFSLSMLYPNPNLRQFGDIDLFVGLDEFHHACAVLRNMPGSYNWGEEVDSGKHFNIEFGQYAMEVHRVSADEVDPDEREAYAAIEREGLFDEARRVSFEGFELSVPSKEFMVFFTFFHAWHHFLTSGVGLRQLSDVAMTLHAFHGSLDLDKLRSYIEAMDLMQPWQTFGGIFVDHIGLPEAEMPFGTNGNARAVGRLYQRVMEEGNFKRQRKFKLNRPKRRLLQKMHAFICIFIDYFHLAKVFPKQAAHELKVSLRTGFRKNLHGN